MKGLGSSDVTNAFGGNFSWLLEGLLPERGDNLLFLGDLFFLLSIGGVILLPTAVVIYDIFIRTSFHSTDEGQKKLLKDRARLALVPDHHFGWSIRTRLKGTVFSNYTAWLKEKRVDLSQVILGAMRHPLYLGPGDTPASIGRLAVAEPMHGGEVLLAIPPHLLFGPQAALKSEIGPVISGLPLTVALTVHLIHEKMQKKETSDFSPYLATLGDAPASFLFWDSEEKKSLAGFSIIRQSERRACRTTQTVILPTLTSVP